MRAVNAAARALIERNEGCVLHAYRDIVNVLTIGYGHTANVTPGQTITQAEADALLESDLVNEFAPGIETALAGLPCTDNQFGALVSLAYNVGLGAIRGSTVIRLHRAGDYDTASNAFLMWDRAGGKVVPALLRRRGEERALYLTPDGSESDESLPAQQPHLPPDQRVTKPKPAPAPQPAQKPYAMPVADDSDAEAERLNQAELDKNV
jgi:lysozyme